MAREGDEGPEKVAVVLSGAAARGAFQAGALAVLIPALEAQGLRPTIWLGTSAGAINVALWGAHVHEGAAAAAQQVIDVWSQMSDDDVFRPLLPFSALRTAAQFAVGAMLERGPGTTSLMNTSPLQRTVADRLPADQLRANVASGVLDAVGVVATRVPADTELTGAGASSGRSVLFLDEHARGDYDGDPKRALDVVRAPVTAQHVVASCSIPVAFPSVSLDTTEESTAWYVDGGVRLNTPLQPAVGLGATRILLVSATSTTVGAPPPPMPLGARPDIADASAQLLHAALADRTTEDLLTLKRVNRVVDQSPVDLLSPSDRPYRSVEVMTVSPPPQRMGSIAAEVWSQRADRFGWLRETDNWLIGRGIRGLGDTVGRRELLSYLFFDEEYFIRGIELGKEVAAEALERGWQR